MDVPPPPKDASRWHRLASGMPTTLGVIASVIAIGGVTLGIYKALTASGDSASAASEAKQVVAFHQVANRICEENQQALERAVPEANSRVQLLAFLSRGTGWGINDLESVTAPPSLAAAFTEEISLRRTIEEALLEQQQAGETGDLVSKAEAVGAIGAAEEAGTEVDHELGLRNCSPVLPSKVRRATGVD